MQNLYNLLYREEEREMIPQCIDQGVGIIPYSPLARGFLAGSRARSGERRSTRSEADPLREAMYGTPEDFDVIEQVTGVASGRTAPVARIALAWLLHKPGLTAPLIGATTPGHIDEARQSLPRSPASPSETSIADEAKLSTASARVVRGSGRR